MTNRRSAGPDRPPYWCEACGTVTHDLKCDCTKYGNPGNQRLRRYDPANRYRRIRRFEDLLPFPQRGKGDV